MENFSRTTLPLVSAQPSMPQPVALAQEDTRFANGSSQKRTLYSCVNRAAAQYRASGNEEDFAVLYEALLLLGKAITMHILRQKQDREDVISSVILRFYLRVNDYNYPAKIFSRDLTWACWRKLYELRETMTTITPEEAEEEFETNDRIKALTVNPFPQVEARMDLESLTEQLRPEAARFFRMLVEQRTIVEIAAHLGLKATTAHTRFRAIKRDLARVIEKDRKLRERRQKSN